MKTSSQEYTNLLQQSYLPGRSLYLKCCIYPRILKRFKRGDVLDMGCGFGEFLKFLMRKKISCCGIDSNENHVMLCNQMGLPSMVGDVLNFQPNKKFQNAVLDNVLEHLNLDEINSFFQNMKNVLMLDGRLFVIVPCLKGQKRDPTHKTLVTERVIQEVAIRNHMNLVEVVNIPTPFEFIGKYFYLQMKMFVLDMVQ